MVLPPEPETYIHTMSSTEVVNMLPAGLFFHHFALIPTSKNRIIINMSLDTEKSCRVDVIKNQTLR